MNLPPENQVQAAPAIIFEPIPAAVLRQARADGADEAGNRLSVRPAAAGSPLRCCLREAADGERLLLMAYTPPGTRGAYAERGPVFIHADPCDGYRTPHAYPPELRDRPQVVRAYNADGEIADGVLARDGDHALTVITGLLARPDVSLVHLRNVGYGCYNFAARNR